MRLIFIAVMLFLINGMAYSQNNKTKNEQSKGSIVENNRKWWKEAIVYQLYPFSFKDSDGDGTGDLKGIISRLDYIKSLGVNVVWLNPIYTSPNEDNGYDISDYRNIMQRFGNMNDFDDLLEGLHRRGVKLIMDLVVNHTSDQHEWFQKSRSSRTNPYRNYYHWWPAEKGKPAHRWSFFDENSDAWAYDTLTNAYYLHYFSRKQPDLNWENPKVRKEIYDMMKFWFNKGVDGFRMDVIPFISKDTTFPELPGEYNGVYYLYYAKGPHMHEYLHEMNQEVLNKYDIMTVGEGAGVQIQDALKFVDQDRKELNMFFHFDAMMLDRVPNNLFYYKKDRWSLQGFKEIYSRWDSVFEKKGWGSIFLGNHDFPRMVSRWGNDSDIYRVDASKMLLTFLLTMRGTPYIFNGDEIGMTNAGFTTISEYRDLQALNAYKAAQNTGTRDFTEFYYNLGKISRDNARTPFQWDSSVNGGFTKGIPWIGVNKNFTKINVAVQEKDPFSTLNFFRKMVVFRKQNPVLIYGEYNILDKENPDVYTYTRTLGDEKWLVILNFKAKKIEFKLPDGIRVLQTKWVTDNSSSYEELLQAKNTFTLQPYEFRIYKIGDK